MPGVTVWHCSAEVAPLDHRDGNIYVHDVHKSGAVPMRSWTITQARANIANLFDAALKSGPQKIERRDSEPVVLIAEADWRRLASEYPAMADLILNCPVGAEALPPRRPARVLAGGFE